ncbi:MAG: tetratricopeptide repeat protein [Chlamydiota bacterium]|nr:tetratricopeptide repeat protein [Chlamydiota bacterium]
MKKNILLALIASLLVTSHDGNCSVAHKTRNAQKYAQLGSNNQIVGIGTAEMSYRSGLNAMEAQDWKSAFRHFEALQRYHVGSEFVPDSYYYAGVSLFQVRDYDVANKYFNLYLKEQNNPKFFEEAIKYKFSIAELLRGGEPRRPFGPSGLPRFLPAGDTAVTIYDEVIAAVPSHELAAQSLFYKGCLLWKQHHYRDSVDAFYMLARRFPKHELTPQAYLNVAKLYHDQSNYEYQNPDIISLAEINLKKFSEEFPREEKLAEAEKEVIKVREVYARGLYETAQFYERTYKTKASLIYYETAIRQFPGTETEKKCRSRLSSLAPAILRNIDEALQAEAIELQDFDVLDGINFEDFVP